MNLDYQFIVYACPVGELNDRLESYFAKSLELYGENAAHKYMPHCTLTGFFTEEPDSIPLYLEALNAAYIAARESNISLDIAIAKLSFGKNWHGLELQADGLKELVSNFAVQLDSTRQRKIRLKNWLHLSLAYGFEPEYREQLQNLAIEAIDLQAKLDWELRFYQEEPDWTWQCLKSWHLISNC